MSDTEPMPPQAAKDEFTATLRLMALIIAVPVAASVVFAVCVVVLVVLPIEATQTAMTVIGVEKPLYRKTAALAVTVLWVGLICIPALRAGVVYQKSKRASAKND